MTPLLLANWGVRQWIDAQQAAVDRQAAFRKALRATYRSGAQVLGNGTAIIPVHGVIDFRESPASELGLIASSEAIRQDFNQLVSSSEVSRIVFDIDSPGGLYSGLPELAGDIVNARKTKPIVAIANPTAASGALWLGAAAGLFLSLGSGQVGSLGALMLHQDASRMFESNGICNTILRSPSGKADFNPLEPLSDQSREHHQDEVERIAQEFLQAMSKFRGVTEGAAKLKFGRGRMLNAKDALRAGLVDGVADSLRSAMSTETPGHISRSRLAEMKLNVQIRDELIRRDRESRAVHREPSRAEVERALQRYLNN